jgi:hypothetical protein
MCDVISRWDVYRYMNTSNLVWNRVYRWLLSQWLMILGMLFGLIVAIELFLEQQWIYAALLVVAVLVAIYFQFREARDWFLVEPTLETSWKASLDRAGPVLGRLPDASDRSFWDNGRIGLITTGELEGRYIFVSPGTYDERWPLGIAESEKPDYLARGYYSLQSSLRGYVAQWDVRWLPVDRYAESIFDRYFGEWDDSGEFRGIVA